MLKFGALEWINNFPLKLNLIMFCNLGEFAPDEAFFFPFLIFMLQAFSDLKYNEYAYICDQNLATADILPCLLYL